MIYEIGLMSGVQDGAFRGFAFHTGGDLGGWVIKRLNFYKNKQREKTSLNSLYLKSAYF